MTVRELVQEAMWEIRQLGADETLDDADADLGLRKLIGLVDMLQGDGYLLYTVARTPFALISAQQVYTVGPTGGFVYAGPRPIWIPSGRVKPVGADYDLPLTPYVNREEWFNEPLKSFTNDYPYRFLYEPTMAGADLNLGTLTFWPIPTTAATVYLAMPVPLTTPVDLDTVIVLPPGGYRRAWIKSLGVEMMPAFEMNDQDLKNEAKDSLSGLRRLNDPGPPPSRCDLAITGGGGYDIRSNGWRR